MREMVQSGDKIWFRNRDQILSDKLAKGGNSSATWHLKGDTTQTLLVPITPNGTLAKSIKDKIGTMIGPDGGKTKIIEQGGSGIMTRLTKNDPFRLGT